MDRSGGSPCFMSRGVHASSPATLDRSPLSTHLAGAKPVVRAALRARDADGRWSETADSICRGRTTVVVSGRGVTFCAQICGQDVRKSTRLACSVIKLEGCVMRRFKYLVMFRTKSALILLRPSRGSPQRVQTLT